MHGGYAREVVAGQPLPAVHVAALPPGWRVYATGTGLIATSWRYRPDSLGPATAMPQGGVIVNVFFPPGEKKALAPLRLVLPPRPATLLEGTTDTPEYRIHGRVSGRDVEVWVDVRGGRPSRSKRRLIQHVLSSLRFG